MAKELEPCPLHKERVMPELSAYEAQSLTPWCATILCPDCGLELSVHEYATEQDAIDAITNMWNTRYKRTCKIGDGLDCSNCGAIFDIGSCDKPRFCMYCGAEVVDGD